MFTRLWLAFLIAFVISLAMTPVAIKIAPKIGALDVPKDSRRMHNKIMPRFGGMAIFLGTSAALIYNYWGEPKLSSIIIGGALIYALGVIDDLRGLKALPKFIIETGVAVLMYFGNIRVNFISNFFSIGHTELGTILTFVITVLWIVGITNAVNLIDGLDGLAAGVSAIAAFCVAYAGFIHGYYLSCGAMLALAGGALGFLPYNFHPAKIFMGDSGSLFLGFMLATISVLGTVKSATLIAIVMPVFVLGLPIFDTGFAIIRRLINKQKIMSPDKHHLHHRLMSLGYGQRRATLMIYCVSAIMGIAAILYSRQLYLETLGLFAIACLMIYIFMTDAEHVIPVIKKEKLAKETMTPCEIADNAAKEYKETKEKIENAEI